MHIFRDHKRGLLIFMFFAIGIPMLFFGIPWGNQGMGPSQDMEVGEVDGVPIMASELYQNLELARRRMTQGDQEPPTFKELHDQGIASNILDEMLSSALIKREENQRGFEVERPLLEERLREDPTFTDDAGNFIPSRFNAWVTAREGMDWAPVYNEIQDRVSRQVYMTTVLSAANRVLDKEVQEELEERSTKIQIEYLKVEPKIEPTDEELQVEYDANKESYREPDIYTADYVAISLLPEPSEEVQTVLEKARAGEDFAALADEYSDLETENGGDLGWVAEREVELDYRKPLFALAPGEVSEPVRGPGGFYIYKAEEERTNEETELREVKARHIYIKVELSEEERAAREALANTIAEKAKESDAGLQTAAAAVEGAPEVQQASGFSVESPEIAGIPTRDAFQFRRIVDEEARRVKEALEVVSYPVETDRSKLEYPVITGVENIYVAEFTEAQQGDIPDLADIREQVADDIAATKKNSDEYKERVEALAEEIKTQAATLDEVKEKFPQIESEIKETRPFTKQDNLFREQVYIQTPEIYAAVEGKEENELAGPLNDFLGGTFFIAVTNREEPTDEDKATWDEEGKELRDQRIQMAQNELLQDYLTDLRERQLLSVDWTINWDVYESIVGVDQEGDEAAGDTPLDTNELFLDTSDTVDEGDAAGEEAPAADDTPAEEPAADEAAPAADEAPAEEPATEEAAPVESAS